MAMKKEGPGKGIATKMAIKKLIEVKKGMEEGKGEPGKKVVTEKTMLEEGSPSYGRYARTESATGKTDTAPARNVYTEKEFGAKVSKADMIKEGFFTEKNGDLYPTAKYQQWKKEGKLTGKYKTA